MEIIKRNNQRAQEKRAKTKVLYYVHIATHSQADKYT